jgi:polyhydroxyalkanoate synthesis repressor PhaR
LAGPVQSCIRTGPSYSTPYPFIGAIRQCIPREFRSIRITANLPCCSPKKFAIIYRYPTAEQVMRAMPAERLIKKYPNRRLYDTSESRYITLDEVRQMVLQEIPFKVVDRQSEEDITRNILLQIIMEQESGGEPMFSADVLARFIRSYGEAAHNGFAEYLENSLRFFTEQQKTIHEQMGKALEGTPMDYWVKLGEQNMKMWQDLMAGGRGPKKPE